MRRREQVAIEDDDVGQPAGLERAEAVVREERRGGVRGARPDGLLDGQGLRRRR